MNISQSIVVIFMTGLLFILLSIVMTSLSDQLKNTENIKGK